jgi:hypothetical protein
MKQMTNYLTEAQAVTCVGKGWERLVRRVYNAKEGMGITVGIIQVKEKFGGLRIYTDYYDSELEQVIQEVGKESLKTCEECGAPAGLVKRGGWFRTLCEVHRGDGIPIPDEDV